MIATPFFIKADERRIVAAIQTEFERAFEHQTARERLNVSQRQSVVRRAAQFVERLHHFHNPAQIYVIDRCGHRIGHSIQAVDRRRNDFVQLATRR